MATRTARRGLGARVILASVAVFAIAAMSLPASAHANSIIQTNVDSGWAAPTKLVPDQPGGKPFDPTDPPWQKADGPVTDLVSRWALTICAPSVTVTGALGPVLGITSLESYQGRPNRVLRFVVNDPAYPHGLTAAASPYTVTFTAGHQEPNGACFAPTSVPLVFGLDRNIPDVPIVTSPATLVTVADRGGLGCRNPNLSAVCDETGDIITTDPIKYAGILSGDVNVEGTVVDPLTWPDDDRQETSGVSRAIVRLYELNEFCALFTLATDPSCSEKVAEYEVLNDCTGVITGTASSDGLPACERTLAFDVDITADLAAGNDYAVDVFAMDKAGDTGNDLTAQTRTGETKSITFHYQG